MTQQLVDGVDMAARRTWGKRRLLGMKIGVRRQRVRLAHRALRSVERWQDRAFEALVDAETEAL